MNKFVLAAAMVAALILAACGTSTRCQPVVVPVSRAEPARRLADAGALAVVVPSRRADRHAGRDARADSKADSADPLAFRAPRRSTWSRG